MRLANLLTDLWQTPFTLRDSLVLTNGIVLACVFIYVLSRVVLNRRDERPPANLTKFLPDEELEGRHLERVLGFALLFVAASAVGLVAYALYEPWRQAGARDAIDERAAERGEVFYANQQMDSYESTKSLQCANCHGVDAGGGSANFVLPSSETGGEPEQVSWRAPALNTVLLRFPEDQVREIITYGRPGTPMPPWGTQGGGPKNEQAIEDLVQYLKSIQLSEQQAIQQSTQALRDASEAQPGVSEGALLFQLNCARCHTKGWSYYDPANPNTPKPGPQGGGAFGPNLRGGAETRQFPDESSQTDFIQNGSGFQQQYGSRGIGSGRMPGFGKMLTDEQIDAIVKYERSLP